MPSYTIDELDSFEEDAASPEPIIQAGALKLVSTILEQNSVTYAVMDGMNLHLRGSTRKIHDINIAVNDQPCMDILLSYFDNEPSVYRPGNKMQWLSGVARLQVDLISKTTEGRSIPENLVESAERDTVRRFESSFQCNLLAIGPLLRIKLRAFHRRGAQNDYIDLCFICKSPIYEQEIREAAATVPNEWKETFLEHVHLRNPGQEQHIRWVLHMDQTFSIACYVGGYAAARWFGV